MTSPVTGKDWTAPATIKRAAGPKRSDVSNQDQTTGKQVIMPAK
jgi:hypothetical protein